jgi:hypothetical protein
LLGFRSNDQPDLTSGPGEVSDVLPRDEIAARNGAFPRCDVIGAGGNDRQVPLDGPQIDPLPTQPQSAIDETVLLYLQVTHSRYARDAKGGLSATHFAIA